MSQSIPFLYVNIAALCVFALMFATFLAAKKTPEIRSSQTRAMQLPARSS